MGFFSLNCVFTVSIFCCCSLIFAQQPYVGKATTACTHTDPSNSVLGYTCNGLNPTCQSYLIFRSQSPYNTISSISALLSSDPSQLSQINSVSETTTFDTNKLVIVPVNCSCCGEYYQANTTYVIQHGNTHLLIANNTFQGLSTCQALRAQNSNLTRFLYSGTRINVPLRCACPTKNQTDVGVKYLLSYIVIWGDFVSSISARFSVDTGRTLEANGLSEQNPTIYPFTTLLIPLQNPPTNSQTIVLPPPPSPPSPRTSPPASSSSKSSNKTWVYFVVGALAGGAFVLVFGIIIFCAFFSENKRKTDSILVSDSFEAGGKQLGKISEEDSQDFLESITNLGESLKLYNFGELQSATENFCPSCCIKESVYRGTINGDLAAIKKMNGDVSKEINLLNKINHFNLIRLSGVCFNDSSWYLVYEYAVKGPLSDWIYCNNSDGKSLNWTQRIQIALDVATGLNYLHSFTSPPHVHKNIKSSNILLDSDFRAKIANFALARSAEGQEGQFSLTSHIVGTRGYMAPEYLENGLVSTKLDVYAFGVLMLEIVTGKEAAALYDEEHIHLSDVLKPMLCQEDGEDGLRGCMDPSIQGNYPSDLVIFVVRLIDSCLKKDPAGRPAMDEVVQFLSKILTTSLNWELSVNVSGLHRS